MKILASPDFLFFFFFARGVPVTRFWSVRCGKKFPGGTSGKGFQKEQTVCIGPLALILTNHCLCERRHLNPEAFIPTAGRDCPRAEPWRGRGEGKERGEEREVWRHRLHPWIEPQVYFPIWGADKSLSSLSRFALGAHLFQ